MSETTFEIHLPSNLLQLGLSKDDIQQRISEWVALSLFTEGKISSGKAARLLNISRIDFLALLRRRGIAYINYSPEELSEEIDSANHIL
jgi:predicted HTH domain antitoxin